MALSDRSSDLEARIVAQAALLLLAVLALVYLCLLPPFAPADQQTPATMPVLQQPPLDDWFQKAAG